MSGLACVPCRKFYRVKKIGVAFEEGMPGGSRLADPGGDGWGPYKLWMGDLCECPGCGAQIVFTATGQQPIAEHYQPTYAAARERFRPIVRIDDCGGKKP